MLADEYGYQVSRVPASSFPGLAERLLSERRTARTIVMVGCLLCAVATVLMWQWWIPAGTGVAEWVIMVSVFSALMGLFFLLPGLFMVLPQAQQLVRISRAHPFQAWPCQLERLRTGEGVVLLLAPDGRVARELRSTIPEDVWRNTADGRGVLWIAGDLRFECLVATPGARKAWRAKGAPYGASPASGAGLHPVEEELIRTVTQEAFSNWVL
ncbi:hypothetical protein [Streptomyces kurssanovii]|uniref:Uncharacterized protein n=1 Tax=Streptomyces kurssanovii TaxID=67312 RepID=A0ABV3HNI2_9ACTN